MKRNRFFVSSQVSNWVGNLPVVRRIGLMLYDFTSFTFTNGTQQGRFGPSLSNLLNSYNLSSNPWLYDLNYFDAVNGIQKWTVPKTGTYSIEAFGAQGGTVSSTRTGGLGARMKGDFYLSQGEIINILVGQSGTQSPLASGNKGGGGGSFVWINSLGSNGLLVAAGGGGGSQASANGVGGVIEQNGTAKSDGTGTPGVNGNGTRNGAGWLTDGNTDGTTAGGGVAPRSITNSIDPGVGGSGHSATHQGGFGGGGGGGGSPSTTQAAGGGGGYSGGAGVGAPAAVGGGGGGSFNSGLNQDNTSSVNSGHGKVNIIFIS